MRKYFPHISAFILTLVIVFAVSGFLFPQTAQAAWWDPTTWITIGDFATDILLSPLGWLAILLLQIASLITYLSGVILNYVVQFTVVDMAKKISDIGTIDKAWKTIRDVANMAFIFVLLYAAIRTILGISSDTKKLIVNIIVVAILINFSLFFTKTVIDASNVLAIAFYDAIAPTALSSTASLGLSDTLMQPLKITSLMKTGPNAFAGKQLIIVGVMGTIVVLIVAFVFFAVAIMFVIRFVILIFVLILSPLAFMGFILPQLKQYKDQWLNALLGQAFFAPIYFMLTWIVIIVSRGLLSSTSSSMAGGDMGAAFTGVVGLDGNVKSPEPGSIALLVNFIIMIVLLIASLIIAKQWANKAGGAVPGLTKWAMGAAGGATLGMAGMAGRKTMGSWGAATASDDDLKARARAGDMGARLKLATANRMAKSSFDIRGTGLGGTLEAGAARKGGFIQDQKDRAKAFEKYKPSKDAVDQAKAEETKTQKELDDAAERAIPKTDAHTSAEERLRDLRKTSTAGFNTQEALAHKAKIDATREEIEQNNEELTEQRRSYIRTADVLASTRARQESNKTARQNLENAMESMATRSERREPTRISARVPFTRKKINFALRGSGYIIGGKDRAAAIRAAAKGKSNTEKLAEAAADLAKEQAETTPPTPPASPTPPTPPAPPPAPPTP